MNPNNPKPHGLSRVIMQKLQDMAPEIMHNSQIIDCHILQELEQQLRQTLVQRPDGSSRLVIDLVLTRSMEEIRQNLGQVCSLPASLSRLEASLNSLASI